MRRTRAAGTVLAMAAAVFLVGGASAQAYTTTPTPTPQDHASTKTPRTHATTPTPRGQVTPMDQVCPLNTGVACFWPGISRTGTRGEVSGNNPDYKDLHNSSGCTKDPGTWNDCIRSIANGGACTIYFWTGANYKGNYHSLGSGDSVDAFGAAPYYDPSFADAISSNHWCSAS